MVEVYSKGLNQTIKTERIIAKIEGKQKGPTVVFFGGIHGNEPSGVFALQKVMQDIENNQTPVNGSVYAITGNLAALKRGMRYIKSDLNRMWTKKKIASNLQTINPTDELLEQQELHAILDEILKTKRGPFYFFDLHTTSSDTIPFITINDTRLNRKFALQYPVPIILGIEEFIDGPLLSYINTLGYVALGFESGRHDSANSIENHVAFIYLTLFQLGCIRDLDRSSVHFRQILSKATSNEQNVFEITSRYKIREDEKFTMHNNFKNFQSIQKGETLAYSQHETIYADEQAKIFMPLYQPQGDDGYFIIKRIPRIFLSASTFLRAIRLDSWLTILPGVNWKDASKNVLEVNQNIARFFARDFLHLMGYRLKQTGDKQLRAKKRENRNANKVYKDEVWLK